MDNFVHVLIEMTSEPNCRFIGTWLMKVAEAEALWSEALRDPDFERAVADLCAFCVPSLECAALEIFCELKRWDHVLAIDLNQLELAGFEFGMMVQLGLFVFNGRNYQMAVPETITLASVRQAALNIVATASDIGDGVEVVQPESLLNTLPQTEA